MTLSPVSLIKWNFSIIRKPRSIIQCHRINQCHSGMSSCVAIRPSRRLKKQLSWSPPLDCASFWVVIECKPYAYPCFFTEGDCLEYANQCIVYRAQILSAHALFYSSLMSFFNDSQRAKIYWDIAAIHPMPLKYCMKL